jgi:hypothetical protein
MRVIAAARLVIDRALAAVILASLHHVAGVMDVVKYTLRRVASFRCHVGFLASTVAKPVRYSGFWRCAGVVAAVILYLGHLFVPLER